MAWPGAVVAEHFRRGRAHEHGTGVADGGQPATGVAHGEFEMLWRESIGHLARLRQIAHHDQRAPGGQRAADDVASRQRRQRLVYLRRHGFHILRVRADEHGLRVLVVFRLGAHIQREPTRRGGAVRHYDHLARPGDEVDAHRPEHQAFRRRHQGAARADDLVHLRHRGGAVRQCGNRLRPAQGEHPVDAGEAQRRQHMAIAFPVRGGHGGDHLVHAGHARRHHRHQRGGGVGGLAARHVDADAAQRRDALAEAVAELVRVLESAGGLAFVVPPDAVRGGFERGAIRSGQGVPSRIERSARQFQLGRFGQR